MIFYLQDRNSRWVAEALGTAFDEPLVSIADALNEGKNAYPLGEREKCFLCSLSILGGRLYWCPALFPG